MTASRVFFCRIYFFNLIHSSFTFARKRCCFGSDLCIIPLLHIRGYYVSWQASFRRKPPTSIRSEMRQHAPALAKLDNGR